MAAKVVAADSGRRTARPCSVGRIAKRIAVHRAPRPTIATKSVMMTPGGMSTSLAMTVMEKNAAGGAS